MEADDVVFDVSEDQPPVVVLPDVDVEPDQQQDLVLEGFDDVCLAGQHRFHNVVDMADEGAVVTEGLAFVRYESIAGQIAEPHHVILANEDPKYGAQQEPLPTVGQVIVKGHSHEQQACAIRVVQKVEEVYGRCEGKCEAPSWVVFIHVLLFEDFEEEQQSDIAVHEAESQIGLHVEETRVHEGVHSEIEQI